MSLTQDELNRLCNEVLSVLEIQEARLLNWGFINGVLTLDDLDVRLPELLRRLPEDSPELAALWSQAQQAGVTGRQILENLERRRLIFGSRARRYRTRFAETIRALFLLRQRFAPDDWRDGDRLVGDLRLLLQRRRFPKREVTAAGLSARLASLHLGPIEQTAVADLLQERGRELVLARFQVDAAERILHNLQLAAGNAAGSGADSAVVIGAGTGAGKTKAFYIPALAAIAGALSAANWVQALAIYPRKELLKDQLRETYAEARKLDRLLERQGKRPIRIGAYYGDVPNSADDLLLGRRETWRRTRDRTGWICPYVPCPECGEQEMVWSKADLELESEDNRRSTCGRYARLTCQQCHATVDATTMLLTRRQMVEQPPDLLFTTTEMLNRRLAHAGEHDLFGVGATRPPRLVLMDEIHLNEGIHGAQVAYLLRRWRHLRRQHTRDGVCIVGLSATLSQADHFFARLTGIPAANVTSISPVEADLVKEGLEYNVVLKGDPVSGTTLLSTSVRAAMLICRILDPLQGGRELGVSAGAYGQRAFAFSDKLDVINRWYHIEKEVENPTEPYSRYLLVDRSAPDGQARYEQGQNWYFVPLIHDDSTILTSGLRLDITSSQYGGVDNRANLVIASSTLEVGYNDATVGAILQHKTPHSRAAFVQRKGRAGRTRAMRPWTVLVTSAYGHDRWAFQHAEQLFDPLLPALDLPLENYYVQKIQAAFALLDWCACQLAPTCPGVNVWQLLSSALAAQGPALDGQRRQLAALLLRLLEDPALCASFKEYLIAALDLREQANYIADTLLWGEPRPLLLEVIPTAVRQLETYWQRTLQTAGGAWQHTLWDDNIADRPLPEYLPAALFSDLKSPDVLVRIPERRVREGEQPIIRDEETMGVALALSEFVPAKVNKRFARKDKIRESHWLELPEFSAAAADVELADLAIVYDPAPVSASLAGTVQSVYCPRTLTLSTVPHYIRPTSSAQFLWASQFVPQSRQASAPSPDQGPAQGPGQVVEATGLPLALRPLSALSRFFPSVAAYTHANGSWVGVTRGAPAVRVFTRYEGGGERRGRVRFTVEGQPAALGFAADVDALKFAYSPFDAQELRNSEGWPGLYQQLAGHYFYHCLRTDAAVEQLQLNDLEVEWLWQVSLTVLIETAIARQIALAVAAEAAERNFLNCARRTLATIFGTEALDAPHSALLPKEPAEEEEAGEEIGEEATAERVAREVDDPAETEEIGYLHAKLLRMCASSDIQQLVARHWPVLWNDDSPQLDAWLATVYAFTLGAALFTTMHEMTPEVQPEDLHLDIDEAEGAIWISEAAAGGVGLIAKLADRVAQHPRQFDLHFLRTLRNCPRAELAEQMNCVAALVRQQDQSLASAFAVVRSSTDLPRMEETRQGLANILERHGVAATRALGVNINMKFLRPNSGPDTDALVAALVEFWQREEQRLACAIDLRAIAASAALDPAIQVKVQSVLQRVGSQNHANTSGQVYNLLQSLLWLDCHDSCPDCIDRTQRYQSGPKPSRAMLSLLIAEDQPPLRAAQGGWQTAARERLAASAQVRIMCEREDLSAAATELAELVTTPVDVESQLLYPAIERIDYGAGRWVVQLALPELAGE